MKPKPLAANGECWAGGKAPKPDFNFGHNSGLTVATDENAKPTGQNRHEAKGKRREAKKHKAEAF
ncbi:MAG: hypothetical protein IPJ50_16860 [Betaproteobacteria bacterium]|nr:hypothetical protein [Betaproteobacteria bacterium]